MTFRTHIYFATPAALLPLVLDKPIELVVPYILGVLTGAVMPDIDEENSWFSKRMPFLMILFFTVKYLLVALIFIMPISSSSKSSLYKVLDHRGVTHFLIVPFILFVVAWLCRDSAWLSLALFGLSVGWVLHQLGDLQTKPGINNWLFPFFIGGRCWVLPNWLRYDVESFRESIVAFLLVIVNLYITNIIIQNHYGFSCIDFALQILAQKGVFNG